MFLTRLIHSVLFAVITCPTSQQYEYVPNSNWAPYSIDACFYIRTGVSGSCKTFRSFDDVKRFMSTPHVKVEIHDQTLKTVRKYSFSRVTYAKELVIRNCGLEEIEPGAFHESLSILRFDIQRNKLEIVKTGVFNYLLIAHLNLAHNRIKTIEPDALSYLQNIEEVNLANNQISSYDWKWFIKTPLLKSLCFQNNTIKEIPERAFRNMIDKPYNLNLFFSFNQIGFIHPLAFDSMPNTTIQKLNLSHNLLETWTEALSMNLNEIDLSFNNIKRIHGDLHATIKKNGLHNLIGNPYECDCLKEIKSIGDRRGEQSDWFLKEYLKCRKERKSGRSREFNAQKLKIFSSP